MKSNQIEYRDLPTWKYQLETDWTYQTGLAGYTSYDQALFGLEYDGVLHVDRGYCWDGPSGPTLDTKDFMRGSLVHDVLYQSIRLKLLPSSARKAADLELDKILKKDGMFWLRRKYVYFALRAFAAGAARSKPRPIKRAP